MGHKDKKDFRRILTGALALLLALLMILPLLLSALTPAGAVTEQELRDKIASLQKEASDTKAERANLQNQLNAVKGQASQALAEKRIRDQELAAIDRQIDNTESQIAYYDDLIAQYDAVIEQYSQVIEEYDGYIAQEEEHLAQAQAKADRQFELFCQRVRASEERGTVSYLSIIFGAESFSDMLDLFTVISDTIDYDNAVISQLRADRQAVADTLVSLNQYKEEQAAQKAGQEEQRAEQAEKRAEQAAKKAELDEQRAEQAVKTKEATDLYNKYMSQQSTYEKLVDAEEAAAAAIEKQLKAYQNDLDEMIRLKQIATGDGYVWPVRSYYTLTSAYGYRTHPITGQKYKLHNGLDIAAPKNTPIHAIKGGIVSISGWDDSYGNYVVVQHGNGNSSLYAHMNKRAVKAGDEIKQDQVIGYVGTTGSSNCYHIHLEILENIKRVDPHDVFVYSVTFLYASSYNKKAEKPK